VADTPLAPTAVCSSTHYIVVTKRGDPAPSSSLADMDSGYSSCGPIVTTPRLSGQLMLPSAASGFGPDLPVVGDDGVSMLVVDRSWKGRASSFVKKVLRGNAGGIGGGADENAGPTSANSITDGGTFPPLGGGSCGSNDTNKVSEREKLLTAPNAVTMLTLATDNRAVFPFVDGKHTMRFECALSDMCEKGTHLAVSVKLYSVSTYYSQSTRGVGLGKALGLAKKDSSRNGSANSSSSSSSSSSVNKRSKNVRPPTERMIWQDLVSMPVGTRKADFLVPIDIHASERESLLHAWPAPSAPSHKRGRVDAFTFDNGAVSQRTVVEVCLHRMESRQLVGQPWRGEVMVVPPMCTPPRMHTHSTAAPTADTPALATSLRLPLSQVMMGMSVNNMNNMNMSGHLTGGHVDAAASAVGLATPRAGGDALGETRQYSFTPGTPNSATRTTTRAQRSHQKKVRGARYIFHQRNYHV